MPLPLSDVAPMVPLSVAMTTALPPVVSRLPFASSNVTVTAEVEVPLATIAEGLAVIVEVPASAGPGVN